MSYDLICTYCISNFKIKKERRKMMASYDNRIETPLCLSTQHWVLIQSLQKNQSTLIIQSKCYNKNRKNQPRTVQYLIWEDYLIAVDKDNEQLSWGKLLGYSTKAVYSNIGLTVWRNELTRQKNLITKMSRLMNKLPA